MRRNILITISLFIVGMVGGIFADQILWPYFVERPLFYQYRLEQSPVYVTEKKEITIQENTALQEAVYKVEKTIIALRSQTTEEEVLMGSGLIVTADGLIVTLAELVPQGSDFAFFAEGKAVAYQILKRDPEENLALIKLEANNLVSRGFADLSKLRLGERVFLIGFTFEEMATGTLLKPGEKIVNEGIVKTFDQDLIQTNISEDISLQGSPLFNIEGEVLGLTTFSEAGQVLAIPVSKIRAFTEL